MPPRTTLRLLAEELERAVPDTLRNILSRRNGSTLNSLAVERGVSRERVRQLESTGQRNVRAAVHRCAPAIEQHWRAHLSQSIATETELFEPLLEDGDDVPGMFAMARWAMRAVIPEVHPLRVMGTDLPGFWTCDPLSGGALQTELRAVADSGPYTQRALEDAFTAFGVPLPIGRALLQHLPSAPLVFSERVTAWVRRSARIRDTCFIILERAGRPVSARVLGRILDMKERNVAAQLERDERFRRVVALHKWALVTWGDLGQGTRYGSTREAMIDVLTAGGRIARTELMTRVQTLHPVTTWAILNQLEDEVFGHHADGTVSMAYLGGQPYEDDEPELTPDVDADEASGIVRFQLPVTRDVLRGSGMPVPRYVTWFAGLRRVPRKLSFEADEGREYVLRRTPGLSSVSSLRAATQELGLSTDCQLAVTFKCRQRRIDFAGACPCHVGYSEGPPSDDVRAGALHQGSPA